MLKYTASLIPSAAVNKQHVKAQCFSLEIRLKTLRHKTLHIYSTFWSILRFNNLVQTHTEHFKEAHLIKVRQKFKFWTCSFCFFFLFKEILKKLMQSLFWIVSHWQRRYFALFCVISIIWALNYCNGEIQSRVLLNITNMLQHHMTVCK